MNIDILLIEKEIELKTGESLIIKRLGTGIFYQFLTALIKIEDEYFKNFHILKFYLEKYVKKKQYVILENEINNLEVEIIRNNELKINKFKTYLLKRKLKKYESYLEYNNLIINNNNFQEILNSIIDFN